MCISPDFFKRMRVMQRLADLEYPLADINIKIQPRVSLHEKKLDSIGTVFESHTFEPREEELEEEIFFVNSFNFNDRSVSLTTIKIREKKTYVSKFVIKDWKLFTTPHKSIYKNFKNKLQMVSHYHDPGSIKDDRTSKDYYRIFNLGKNGRIQKVFEKENNCSTNYRRLFFTDNFYGWWNGIKGHNPPLKIEIHIFSKKNRKRLKTMVIDLSKLRKFVGDHTGDNDFSLMIFFHIIEIVGNLFLTTNETYPGKNPGKPPTMEFCCFYNLMDNNFKPYVTRKMKEAPVIQDENTKEVVMNMIYDGCFGDYSRLLSFYKKWGIFQKIELRTLGVRIYIGTERSRTVFIYKNQVVARVPCSVTRDFELRKAQSVDLINRKFIMLTYRNSTQEETTKRIFIPTKNIVNKFL